MRWYPTATPWQFFYALITAALAVTTTNLKAFMFHNNTIFSSTLSGLFRMSTNWRKAQARRYAYDARNAWAAQCLLALESGINFRENVWQHLEPLVANPA
jgi:hypothetical protein